MPTKISNLYKFNILFQDLCLEWWRIIYNGYNNMIWRLWGNQRNYWLGNHIENLSDFYTILFYYYNFAYIYRYYNFDERGVQQKYF